MRKLIYGFGLFASSLTLVLIVGFGYLAYKAYGLDNESKAYANSAVKAITSTWNDDELLRRASPNLLKSATSTQFASIFSWFRVLGPPTSGEECKGSSEVFASVGQASSTTARYFCNAQYQHGAATIDIAMIKIDTKWMINGFHVNSPALLAYNIKTPGR